MSIYNPQQNLKHFLNLNLLTIYEKKTLELKYLPQILAISAKLPLVTKRHPMKKKLSKLLHFKN